MTSKEITLKLYTDPGHGWVCVKIEYARELGILDKISHYSYMKGKSVYLEEDGDLSLLCSAIKERGDTFKFNSKHTDATHPIRSYESFSVSKIK